MADELDNPRVSKKFQRAVAARLKRCITGIRGGVGIRIDPPDKDGVIMISLDTTTQPKARS